MLPFALLVGYKADTWGRKPLFLAGFAILPIRAVLYTLSDNSFWLIGVQLLDGVGAGIFGALAPLVIADIMRGTGRYNLPQGAIATMQGIGASLSGLAAGEIVDHFGYSATFLTLGAAALVAVIVFFLQMPETAQPATESPQVKSVVSDRPRAWANVVDSASLRRPRSMLLATQTVQVTSEATARPIITALTI
jgi:MFS family permease